MTDIDDDIDDLTELTQRAEALLAAALKAGASAADVVGIRQMSLSVDIRSGTLEEVTRAEARDLGLRVFDGQRTAIVSTSNTDAAAFPEIAERAVAMARVAPEDAYAGLASRGEFTDTYPELDIWAGPLPSAEALEAMARSADDAARSADGITNTETGASAAMTGVTLLTSEGFEGGYQRTRQGVSASAVAGSGTGMERDYAYSYKSHPADVDPAEDVGRRAADQALARLNPRKAETQQVTVVYDPRVSGGLVASLASAANGAAIARGTSFLKDRMGETILPTSITVTDNPRKPRGIGSRPFDGDGLATAALDIVKDGVLSSWVLDLATARELGLKSTGHAARTVSSAPTPSTSNLAISPGPQSPEDLMRAIGTGFYVTELIGMGANLVTGDYSRGAAGFWIENGEIAYPVSEVTIAGSLKDMFLKLVLANDITDRYAIAAPTIAIEGMTLAGR
ncbi:MAG: TldD/PmbA family protein [Pseudomonadota bacterium]